SLAREHHFGHGQGEPLVCAGNPLQAVDLMSFGRTMTVCFGSISEASACLPGNASVNAATSAASRAMSAANSAVRRVRFGPGSLAPVMTEWDIAGSPVVKDLGRRLTPDSCCRHSS